MLCRGLLCPERLRERNGFSDSCQVALNVSLFLGAPLSHPSPLPNPPRTTSSMHSYDPAAVTRRIGEPTPGREELSNAHETEEHSHLSASRLLSVLRRRAGSL